MNENMLFQCVEKKETKVNAVMIFVTDEEGNILLLKRIDNQSWEPVKGGIFEGESWQNAAFREMKEESGLSPVGDVMLLKVVDDELTNSNGEKLSINGHVGYCFVSGVKPDAKLSEEDGDIDHDAYKWVSSYEIAKERIYPPLANDVLLEVLEHIQKERK